MRIGARCRSDGGCDFALWAPARQRVELKLSAPREEKLPMERDSLGYWRAEPEDVPPGSLYTYLLDGELERPDPASHAQPLGVHGPSQVVDHTAFPWTDQAWTGIELGDMVLYELHVGTFSPQGTFEAIVPRLPELRRLGVTALELMPVAPFPGNRNWGYDGVYPFGVHSAYGGPMGLKRLVEACHACGLAVVLDVVYNHLGPEGNYLADFGPYFTDTYRTPWGQAVNFDGRGSDEVRNFFVENALHWIDRYHVDALRLDAIHAIYDVSPRPFLEELAEDVQGFAERVGREIHLIAESDRNDARFLRPPSEGGVGLDAGWCDDFHHSLHVLLTGEESGYYVDFGEIEQMAKAFREGYVFSGQRSRYRGRRHGSSSAELAGSRLVVFSQNHDQVGNRMRGERLSRLVSFEALRLAAAAVLLSPYVPLLFMGEEYGEDAPFLYFVSHGDENLVAAVREGRSEEFRAFGWNEAPPDPQAVETFENSRLRWEERTEGAHASLLEFYRELLRLRREVPALAALDKQNMDVAVGEGRSLILRRWRGGSHAFCGFGFGRQGARVTLPETRAPSARWRKVLDTAEPRWGGPGSDLPGVGEAGSSLVLPGLAAVLYLEGPER